MAAAMAAAAAAAAAIVLLGSLGRVAEAASCGPCTPPPDLQLCKKKDPNLNECIRAAVTAALPLMETGLKDLGVPKLEPLYFPRLQINNGEGAVKVKLTFTDLYFSRLPHVQLTDADLDLEKPALRLEGDLDRLKMDGLYAVDGQVLLLPITGSGPANVTLDNAHYILYIDGQFLEKNGRRYWDVGEFKLKVIPGKLTMQLENLFNGDKTIGKQMNRFLNENSDEILNELLEPIEEGVSASLKQMAKRIFVKVPFDDIFLD